MRLLLATFALLAVAAPAFAQSASGGGCPFGASSCTVTATGGTTARTLADSAADVVNVRDFGAKCDGSTDDATALQAVMTYATSHANSLVYFPRPPGGAAICMMSANILVPSNTTLWAAPGTVTLKPTSGNTSSPVLLNVPLVSGVLVYGLTIDGGGQDFGTTNNVAQMFTTDNVVFDHVAFQHTRGIAALFSTSITKSGVRDSTFTDIGNHWKTSGLAADRIQAVAFCCGVTASSFGNFTTNNVFSDIGLDAVSTGNQSDFLVAHNRFYMNNGQTTFAWNNPQPSTMAGAVYSSVNTQITIHGNIINGASGNCIDMPNTTAAVVTNNFIIGCGDAGIGVFGVQSGTVSGNVVLNTGQWAGASFHGGIAFNNFANGAVALTGNVAMDNQGSPTQQFGVWAQIGASFTSGLRIDASNSFDGNLTGRFGGALANYAPLLVTVARAVSALPTCSASTEGTALAVTDSTTATWGGTIAGSSTNHVLAYCDGTNWTVAGK